MQAENPLPRELFELADKVGDFIHNWGFKRVHGRIWTHLALAKEPLDAGELIKRLGVSKALISMSLSDLQSYDVIMEHGKSVKGTTLYRVNPDIMAVVSSVIRRRERGLIRAIESCCHSLKVYGPDSLKSAGLDGKEIRSLGILVSAAACALDHYSTTYQLDFSPLSKMRLAQEAL